MGTGGMRYGAGRPGYRLVAEHSKRIDVRRWRKLGHLKAGMSFVWQWTCDGEATGSISVISFGSSLRLNYLLGTVEEWRDASQTVQLATTPCHYGGSRPWFICPACHLRAGVLYLRSGRFACRKCQRVSYRSQSGSAIDRVCNKYHRLADAVEAGKPKWQRWATFEKLEDRFEIASERFENVLMGQLRTLGYPDGL